MRITWKAIVKLAENKGLIAERQGRTFEITDNRIGVTAVCSSVIETYSTIYYWEIENGLPS